MTADGWHEVILFSMGKAQTQEADDWLPCGPKRESEFGMWKIGEQRSVQAEADIPRKKIRL